MRISDWSSDVCSSDLPRDILEPRDRAILRVGLDHDIGEFLRRDEPALHVDGQLEGRIALAIGRRADRAAGDLDTLPLARGDDFARGQIACRRLEIGMASCRDRVCEYV